MDDVDEPWVRLLRDGEIPPVRWLVITCTLVVLIGAVLLVAEARNAAVVSGWSHSRVGFLVVLIPLAMVIGGPVLLVSSWSRGRGDRRTLQRIAAGPRPAFFLPVETTAIREPDDLPRPRPTIWTVDGAGMHAWHVAAVTPSIDLPWSEIRSIGLATTWARGQRHDHGIWLDLGSRHVVLRPRTTLGRPFGAGAAGRDTLLRVLRSLRPT